MKIAREQPPVVQDRAANKLANTPTFLASSFMAALASFSSSAAFLVNVASAYSKASCREVATTKLSKRMAPFVVQTWGGGEGERGPSRVEGHE